jgi:predicted GH43/DUF377 family glycosyl hydrolase
VSVRWRKLGLVYVADGERPWQLSHAYCPTPFRLDEQRIRVFCAFLDADMVGRVGYVDVAASDPTKVLAVSEQPVLDIGAAGTFDDHGVVPMTAVSDASGALRLYYTGFELGTRVRYFMFTGLAESTDAGESFARVSQVPVLDRSDSELYVRTAANVRPDGDQWRMWYIGGSQWIGSGSAAKPSYVLHHSRSGDGVEWPRAGARVMELAEDGDEFGFGRPCVLEDSTGMRMWYSIRTLSKGYRIGYAVSQDGLQWERRDQEAGITVSPSGWDSEMVGMTAVFENEHGMFMFYNGNDYGRTGFGVAIAEQ